MSTMSAIEINDGTIPAPELAVVLVFPQISSAIFVLAALFINILVIIVVGSSYCCGPSSQRIHGDDRGNIEPGCCNASISNEEEESLLREYDNDPEYGDVQCRYRPPLPVNNARSGTRMRSSPYQKSPYVGVLIE